MYTPKASFLGWFTREGRLKNQWARGLGEKDFARGLNELRQVQQNLMKNPVEFGHLWIPFIETCLDPVRVGALTEQDMAALVEMGNVLSKYPAAKVHAEDVWQLVVQAHDARKDELRSRSLLVYMYKAPSTSREKKAECARGLGKRRARGDEHIDVYIDHLKQVPEPSKEFDIIKLLSEVCAVDFDTDSVRLKRACEVARHLANNNIMVENIRLALGMHALLVENAPIKAIDHFYAVVASNPRDRTAAIGLLTCLVRTGEYGKVEAMTRNLEKDNITAGLVELGYALKWLNDLEAQGPAPCTAVSLSGYDIGKYAGESLESTIGILYLLEGDAKRASGILSPLAVKRPDNYQWCYYAAWSMALCGDKEAIARYINDISKWEARWAIICLMMDVSTDMLENAGIRSRLGQSQGAYPSIVSARVALARGESPVRPEWAYEPNAGTPISLEALRTMIGYALYSRDAAAAQKAISMPMFLRLPIADQLLWRGLYAVKFADALSGRTLLEESAVKFGYPRAALALSVYLLETGKIREAAQWLDKASSWANNTKIELIRAYIEACEDKVEIASERLEKLAAKGEPRAYYALGNLSLHRADLAGDAEQGRMHRGKAAEAFRNALGKQDGRLLPDDCKALAMCSEFLASPESLTGPYDGLWSEVEKLDPCIRRPWLVWSAFVAQLWCGTPAGMAASGENALKLAGLMDLLGDPELAAVASAIAYACVKADDVDDADRLIMLLEYLSSGNKKTIAEPYYRSGVAALAHKGTLDPDVSVQKLRQKISLLAYADPGNASLALLLARMNIQDKKLEESVTALRNAMPESAFEQRICASIADLLKGNAALEPPQPPAEAGPEIAQACHLLQAASAFCAGDPAKGYKSILDAMKLPAGNLAKVIEISRVLPALCMQSARDPAPPRLLIDTIREIAARDANGSPDGVIARCAAAMGEADTACRLWDRELSRHPDSRSGGDYAEFLCYLAIMARNSGKHNESIEKLRLAATIGGMQHA
jgi:thioredoxin-like negative regulator of GroEL